MARVASAAQRNDDVIALRRAAPHGAPEHLDEPVDGRVARDPLLRHEPIAARDGHAPAVPRHRPVRRDGADRHERRVVADEESQPEKQRERASVECSRPSGFDQTDDRGRYGQPRSFVRVEQRSRAVAIVADRQPSAVPRPRSEDAVGRIVGDLNRVAPEEVGGAARFDAAVVDINREARLGRQPPDRGSAVRHRPIPPRAADERPLLPGRSTRRCR